MAMRVVVVMAAMAMAAVLLLSVQVQGEEMVASAEAVAATTEKVVVSAEAPSSTDASAEVPGDWLAPNTTDVSFADVAITTDGPAAAPTSDDVSAAAPKSADVSSTEGFDLPDENVTVPEGASFTPDTAGDVPTYDSYAQDDTLATDFPSFAGEKSFDQSYPVDDSSVSFAEGNSFDQSYPDDSSLSFAAGSSFDQSYPDDSSVSFAGGNSFDQSYPDDSSLSLAGESSFDQTYPDEASFADIPNGNDAYGQDPQPLDHGLAEQADTFQAYNVNEETSAGLAGVPPGFDVDETGNTAINATDSDVAGLSFAAGGGGCQTGNMIDDCWRCDATWASHRQSLANCAQGFGTCAIGGRNGPLYWVTSPRDDNPASPAPGTLRYAVTRPGPLWIVFKTSMTIKLKLDLMVTSFKTIDGRGVTVRITGGAGITLQYVNNVIIHGLYIHDVFPTGPGRIMSSTSHVGYRGRSDGDAISVFSSKCVWIDHCYFARGKDGLVDVIRGSNMVTISNNFFTQHDKVILLGAHKNDYMDRDMKVTVIYNVFGPGLVQRMPRVRFGNAHVVNNDYTSGWGIYAIGGSEAPMINCEGNLFQPGRGPKGVAKKVWDGGGMFGGPGSWPWRQSGNEFRGGSYFTTSGPQTAQVYAKATSCTARPAYMVEGMTRSAGPLSCTPGRRC